MIDINRVLDGDDRPRAWRRTIREGAGILARDSARIFGFDEPVRRKLVYLGELLRMVCYYVVDLSSRGRRGSAGVEQRSPDLDHSRRSGSL
jgi:hypothetical protein